MTAAFALAACASSPPAHPEQPPSSARAPSKERKEAEEAPAIVRFDLDSAMPIFRKMRENEALLASKFSASVNDDRLRYKATWSVEPGDVFAPGEGEAAKGASPTRFGGQQLGQNVSLRLPALAGAPLSLGVSTEFRNDLLVAGVRRLQRERASLSWSPGPATVDVQWAGTATPFNAGTALDCDLRSTIRLPTQEGRGYSEGLVLSGGACAVAADDKPYGDLETQTWGLGYVWNRPNRQSEALLSVIDPAAASVDLYRSISPAYELDLIHRRDFGPLSAEAQVSMRQAPVWEYAAPVDFADAYASDADANWTTQTSLTWNLQYASLSANWANGMDRLWFTPDMGRRNDRFGLALNLSRWIEALVPEAAPKLAMNWNWSQVRLPDDEVTGNNALRLDVALNF